MDSNHYHGGLQRSWQIKEAMKLQLSARMEMEFDGGAHGGLQWWFTASTVAHEV
ncbi:uncharacterized protein G2W53_000509 [Senna tora]|uniref:Uncharacterized protein n=1 Tax=Senna tora TaxID=362788 RepID=A0A834XFV1_9FABA|nr:uncharacterized protein G2W53_000509 [Senna tora]